MAIKIWHWTARGVEASAGEWTLTMDPTFLEQGVLLSKNGAPQHHLFRCLPMSEHQQVVEEAYERQRDLIIRYKQSDLDRFGFQLNFRMLDTDSRFPLGIEAWVSIQTDDLDSEPRLKITSDHAKHGNWQIFNHGQVMGDPGLEEAKSTPAMLLSKSTDEQLVWFVEPTDQRHAELVETSDPDACSLELFGHFMEKGVIRRARMRAYLLDAETGPELLKNLYLEFANSPLPLTA